MTTLRKIINTVYTPGSPGVVGSPGTPAHPAYTSHAWVTTVHPATSGSFVEVPAPAGPLGDIRGSFTFVFVPGTPAYTTTDYVATYVPASAGTPPVIGVPATKASITTDFQLGWTATANGINVLSGDGALTFSAGPDSLGVFIGLNRTEEGADYNAFDYAFYITEGKFSVYEKGLSKTGFAGFSLTDVFHIQRVGSTVSYYLNSERIYTSTVLFPLQLTADVVLYSGGDTVVDAAYTSEINGNGTSAASMLPLATYAYQGVLCSNSMLPLTTVAYKRHAGSVTAFSPLITEVEGHAGVGASVAMQPMRSVSANYDYTYSITGFLPLATDASSGGIVPSYALSANALPYMQSYGIGLTGELLDGHTVMEPLIALAADHAYGESRGKMLALSASGGNYRIINGYALLTLTDGYAVDGEGSVGTVSSFRHTLAFSAIGYGGASADLTLPTPLLAASGTGTVVGRARLAMPSAALIASGTTGSVGEAVLSLAQRYSLLGYSGAVLSITLTGGYTVVASGTQGSIGKAVLKLPLFELVASGSLDGVSTANLTMPMLRPAASGLAYLMAPSARLVATGYAVIAATYEAYAMNMLMPPIPDPSVTTANQITHYTNYPFTQIVRYNGSYFGVGSDGLYLLEGDTDNNDPIPWAIQTAMTSFGSKQMKRVVSVYVSGRVLSEIDFTVVVGEESEDIYHYTTPRSVAAQNYRQQFGKGLRSTYYAFGMADPAGNFVEIDSINIEVEVLERAI